MSTPASSHPPLGLRHHRRDALVVAAALAQAAGSAWLLVATVAAAPAVRLGAAAAIGAGIWWNANTIAHIHMHRPLFRGRAGNRAFAAWLSLTTLIPQSIWRHRHLWHHTGRPGSAPALRRDVQLTLEFGLIVALVLIVAALDPAAVALTLAPAFGLAMALCQAQGHYEHREAGRSLEAGISHYGRLYNVVFFHDGFHVEHHLEPARHWTTLPALRPSAAVTVGAGVSGVPPVLRWATPLTVAAAQRLAGARNRLLGGLERLAMAAPPLGRFMVFSHRRAFAALLAEVAPALAQLADARVVVVGGGLFPRTLLALEPLLPRARFVVVDGDAESVAHLRRQLAAAPALAARTDVEHADLDPAAHAAGAALVVLPLALRGDPLALAARCGGLVICHRWLLAPAAGPSRTISWLLCKRLDAVLPIAAPPSSPAP